MQIRVQSPESRVQELSTRFALALDALTLPSLNPGLWTLNSPLAIALSGGADSMALTLLAEGWARTHGARIVTLTVDHGLRPESRQEAEQVARWMAARGIEHHLLTPPPLHHLNNLQEAARQRRYDALAEWCHAHGVLHCLLAHHAGDQAETVALMQARGDTADGAAGMAAARHYRGVRFLRPLLGIDKKDLKKFLHARAAGWVEDPSNQNTKFARVRVRGALANDAATHAALLSTARAEGAARAARDDALAEAAASLVTMHPTGFAELPLTGWAALAPALASQLIADLLTTISGRSERPRAADTERLCAAFVASYQSSVVRTETSSHHSRLTPHPSPLRRTLHGCEISVSKNTIIIAREVARVAAPITLRGTGTTHWDDRFRVHHALPADMELSLRALGNDGKKLLATGHWPLATPSLWHLDRLVYVPYLYDTLPENAQVRVGFAPRKPLAAAPFWWLKEESLVVSR